MDILKRKYVTEICRSYAHLCLTIEEINDNNHEIVSLIHDGRDYVIVYSVLG